MPLMALVRLFPCGRGGIAAGLITVADFLPRRDSDRATKTTKEHKRLATWPTAISHLLDSQPRPGKRSPHVKPANACYSGLTPSTDPYHAALLLHAHFLAVDPAVPSAIDGLTINMTKFFSITGALFVFPTTSSTWASEWTPTVVGNNWSDAANWTPSGVPSAAGSSATYSGASTTSTTINSGGPFTVGTISKSGSDNAQWDIRVLASLLNLNQDGAGSGFATISNSNTSTGISNQLLFGQTAGSINLQDDLLVTNTGASTVANGSISIRNPISGAGNVTFSNVANSVADAGTYAGAIRLQTTSGNSFTGSVLVEKGALVFANSTAFGSSANTVTLGKSGSGSATMLAVTSPGALTVANNIVVASGSGGTLVLGSVITTGTNATNYSGTLTLNGDVSFRSENTGAAPTLLSGVISGAGTLTKIGAGVGTISNALNTYTGATKVSAGTLNLGDVNAIETSPLEVTGAGTVGFTVLGLNTYTLGGLVNNAGTGAAGTTVVAGGNSIALDPSSESSVTIATGTDFAATPAVSCTAAAFTFGGNLTVAFNNQLASGTYLFDLFGGNTGGTFTTVSIASSYVATLNAGNGYSASDGTNVFAFNNTTGTLSLTPVPEPGALSFAAAALLGTLMIRRRRAKV